MKPIVLSLAVLSYLAGVALCLLIMYATSLGSEESSCLAGAYCGTVVAVLAHGRKSNAKLTVGGRAILGAVLTVCGLACALILHLTFEPLRQLGVSLVYVSLPSFFLPFLFFNVELKRRSKSNAET